MSNARLRTALKDAGLEVDDLASLVQVDLKTVQRWLSGRRNPYPRHRTKVARAVGVSEVELWPDLEPQVREQPPAAPAAPDEEEMPADAAEPPSGVERFGPLDWRELIESATSNIDLLDYTLAEVLHEPDLVDTVLRKGASGVNVRVLVSVSQGIEIAEADLERELEPGVLLDPLAVPSGEHPIAKGARASEEILWGIKDEPGIDVRQYRAQRYNSIIRGDDRMIILIHTWGVATADAMQVYTTDGADDGGVFQRFATHFDAVWDHSVALDHPFEWEDLEDWELELDRINQPNQRVYQYRLNEAREEYHSGISDEWREYEAKVEQIINDYRSGADESDRADTQLPREVE